MFGQHQQGKSEVWEICLHVLSVNPEIWIKKSWQWAFRIQLSIDLMKVSWQQMLSNRKLIQSAPYVWSGTCRVSQLKEQLTGYIRYIGPDSWMTNICHSNAFPTALWQSSEAMWATVGNWWSRSRRRSSQLATGQCTHFAKRRTAHSTSSHRTQYITAPLSGRCTLTFTLEVPFLPPLKVDLGGVWMSTVKLSIFCTIEIEI